MYKTDLPLDAIPIPDRDTVMVVGVALGPHVSSERAVSDVGGVQAEVGLVRRGRIFFPLPMAVYELWSALRRGASMDMCRALALELQIDDLDDVAVWLRQVGLLAKVDLLDMASIGGFCRTHRLVPAGIGNGNSVEAPLEFVVSTSTLDPIVALSGPLYAVWSHSSGAESLADAVGSASAVLLVPEMDLREQTVRSLAKLISTGAAFIDSV